MLSDLGRAVVEETPMRRRAMSYVHDALIRALDLPMYSVVTQSIGADIKAAFDKARTITLA